MAVVKCSGCKKKITCDEINPKTKQLYKSCQHCRTRNNTNWKQIVFGKNNNDTASADNASSESDSNATDQTLQSELDDKVASPREVEHHTEQTLQPELDDKVASPREVEHQMPQMTLNQKINNILSALSDTSKDIKNTIDGHDTNTKLILEQIHSDLMNLRMILDHDADHGQVNGYELKLDKLVSRMDNLETTLQSKISEMENCLSKKINSIRELI